MMKKLLFLLAALFLVSAMSAMDSPAPIDIFDFGDVGNPCELETSVKSDMVEHDKMDEGNNVFDCSGIHSRRSEVKEEMRDED